jgi:hypothetical protein
MIMRKTILALLIASLSLTGNTESSEAPNKEVEVWNRPGQQSWERVFNLKIPALPATSGLPPVAVYLFQDSRQESGGPDGVPYITPVGASPTSPGPPPFRTSEPLVLPVTRAIIEGLKARGFPVVDRSQRVFQVGDPADGARRGLRGQLLRFAIMPGWLTENPWEGKYRLIPGGILCVVSLEVFDLRSGETLWEKTYSGGSTIGESSGREMERQASAMQWPLAKALAVAVENAVMDPELTDLLSRN